MKKLSVLVCLSLFLIGCLFFQGPKKNKTDNSFTPIPLPLPKPSRPSRPSRKPPKHKPSYRKIRNLLIPVPSDISDEVIKMPSFKQYSKTDWPEIELSTNSTVKFKVFLMDDNKSVTEVTDYVVLSSSDPSINVVDNTTIKIGDSIKRKTIKLKAITKDTSKDASMGYVNIIVTPVPVCGNGYKRNIIWQPSPSMEAEEVVSGTDDKVISSNSNCLKLATFHTRVYYSGTPSLTVVKNLHVTQNSEAQQGDKAYYFELSKKDSNLSAQFPAFVIPNRNYRHLPNQYNNWCNLLKKSEFAGLTTWKKASYQQLRLLELTLFNAARPNNNNDWKWPTAMRYLKTYYDDATTTPLLFVSCTAKTSFASK